MDGENFQPICHIQIPSPRVVAPPRTPEHKIFSLSSFILPTTNESEESDSDDFNADTRDPNNFTFDEFVDGNDENMDDDVDDNDVLFLDDSVTFDKNTNNNPVSFIFFFLSSVF